MNNNYYTVTDALTNTSQHTCLPPRSLHRRENAACLEGKWIQSLAA